MWAAAAVVVLVEVARQTELRPPLVMWAVREEQRKMGPLAEPVALPIRTVLPVPTGAEEAAVVLLLSAAACELAASEAMALNGTQLTGPAVAAVRLVEPFAYKATAAMVASTAVAVVELVSAVHRA